MRNIFLFSLFIMTIALFAGAPDQTTAGLYVPPNDDWPTGIGRVVLSRMSDPARKRAFWEKHRELCQQGKRQYYVFELNFAKPKDWKYPLPPWESAKAQLDDFFRSDDGAKAYSELIYAIVPNEENITWGGQIDLMNRIYDYVTRTYGVKVFQWLSEPLEPRLDIRADGWLLDAYSIQDEKFFRHLQKFVLYGKPVIPVIWASEPHHHYYPNGIEEIFHDAGSQIDYCAELNLPVILYAVSGKKKNFGSVYTWVNSKESPYAELREFFYNKLAKTAKGEFTRREHPLTPLRITPNRQRQYHFETEFNTFKFVDQCRIQNVHALQTTTAGTTANTDGAVLEWLWESPIPVTSAPLKLDADGTVDTEFMADGKKVQPPFRNFRTLRLRLMPRQSAVLKKLELSAEVPFVRNPPTLWTGAEHKEIFKDNAFMADWDYADTPFFSSGPNGLAISPGKGYAAHWSAVRHFRSEKPVNGLELTVQCRADAANWNSSVIAGISPDGKNIRWSADTAALDRKRKQFDLTLPVRFDAPTHEFYVHLQMHDGSGSNAKRVTASIQSLTLKGSDR